MTNRGAALRYARALLDVAVREGQPDEIEQQLAGFVGLMGEHALLQRVLVNPAVPAPRKRGLVAELLQREGFSPILLKLLLLLAGRDRLVVLPELLAAYRDRLLDHRRVVRAEVTTAVELPRDRAAAVERSLAATTGMTVSLVTKVDASIIGGVVTRIGSVVYDGSIVRHLERLRGKLAGE